MRLPGLAHTECDVKKFLLVVTGAVLVVFGGLYALVSSEFTDCYASFESGEAAQKVATAARFAGFDSHDVEDADDPYSRRSISRGARQISVMLTTGETGDDATELMDTFRRLVKEHNGSFGHSGGGCLEQTYFN